MRASLKWSQFAIFITDRFEVLEHIMTVAHHLLQRLPLQCIEFGFRQDGVDVLENE